MYRIFIFLLSIFLSNSLVAQQEFIMGIDTSAALCEGILYDSGGSNGRYQAREDFLFTICPTTPPECLRLNVETFDIEPIFDKLYIFSGSGINGVLLGELDGSGSNRSFETAEGCITVHFVTDEVTQANGFKITWKCETAPCFSPSFSTCDDPFLVSSLPFEARDFTTCGAGNSIQTSPCFSNYLENEEFIFVYDSPGNECLELRATNMRFDTGLGVYADCPDVANDCIAYENSFMSPLIRDAYIPVLKLEAPGRYYFVVGHPDDCTNFDLIINRIDCPITFPTATRCEDALPITGCNIEVPASISVALGNSERSFIQDGINNGCWKTLISPNFSWFYFEAQADGKFGFLVESLNPNDTSDYDINIWGPLNSPNQFCDFSRNNQPIRSTYADDRDYELTGLVDFNPFTNQAIFDECEDENGDGFVTKLDVKEGEYYTILVNDFDGIIFSGGVAIDFSGTTEGVLGTPNDNFSLTDDLTICNGGSAQLEVSGGLLYHWLNSDFLSCDDCPDPIANPSESMTYEVEVKGVCNTDTLSVKVSVDELNFNKNIAGCAGDDLILETNLQNGNFSWTISDGNLSCDDCPNPILTLPDGETIIQAIFETQVDNCDFKDTIFVEVMPIATVDIQPSEVSVCEGEVVELKAVSSISGGTFFWSNNEETAAIQIEADADEIYIVTFQSPNGCGEATDSVEVLVTPTFSIESLQLLPSTDTLYVGCEIEASLSILPFNLPDLTYEWYINNESVSDEEILTAMTMEEGELTIEARVTSHPNCMQSITIKRIVLPVDEIIIPNIFSPNGDSRNAVFKPFISPKAKLIDMKIYNRWGQMIYNNDSNQIGWEGKFKDKDQPVGVYIYQISVELPNGQIVPKHGDITLMR